MIGIVINKNVKNDPNVQNLIDHEMVHWKQCKKYRTILYLILYLLDILYHGYDLSLFEIEARYNESNFGKYYYTYAVREGLAKTPQNINFRKGKKFNSPITA